MTDIAISRRGVPIRLNDERWEHIASEHLEMAGLRAEVLMSISEADRVVVGNHDTLWAVRQHGTRYNLVVVYREVSPIDGFVITAFLTSRTAWLDRRQQIWPN